MKKVFQNIIPAAAAVLLTMGFSSCVNDLDVTPIDPNLTLTPDRDAMFNECYANFGLEGNKGDGNANITADDAGTAGLVLQLFNTNELSTDEAISGWGDGGIKELVINAYGSGDTMERIYWDRLYKGISDCNQYLSVFGAADATMTAEVRFLRAFQYYLLMDAFGNVPFSEGITHTEAAPQYTRAQMFAWIENELKENVIPNLGAAVPVVNSATAGYGRVNKAAAWLLLARLYLNAEVYTGIPRWNDAKDYADLVIASPYDLYQTPTIDPSDNGMRWSAYQKLFMGDNGESGAAIEAIFPILQQGDKTAGYGCSEFLIASTFNTSMHPDRYDPSATNGTTEAWGGNRARKALVRVFFDQSKTDEEIALLTKDLTSYEMAALAGDQRALFWAKDHSLVASNRTDFGSGYGVCKFTNFRTSGTQTNAKFCDTDYFIMRYAEALLTSAEAEARIKGGLSATDAGTTYLNNLRLRAGAATKSSYTVRDILDEWQKEFYFEGHRRVDLIRYKMFGGSTGYQWEWKNGAEEGANFPEYRNIFAIPNTEAPNFYKQNPNY